MTATDATPVPAARNARRFRILALVVLLLGAAGMGVVYWRSSRPDDLSNDLSMVNYYKARSRQAEQLYGKQGVLMQDLLDDLKEPDIQALIILLGSALLAGGCFYVARLLDLEAERTDQ